MTIKDIARISGYGVSTVSRALNGHPDISEETRKIITAVAEKYNFVPNANARQLKCNSSKTIILIVKGTFNIFFSALVENLQTEIDKSGYNLSLHYLDTNLNEVELAKRVMCIEKPVGIIFLGGDINNFNDDFENSISVPCILCSTSAASSSLKNLSSVSINDFDAGRKAIDYLFEQGHRNIGIIGGDNKALCTPGQRFDGAKESLRNHDISFDTNNYEYTSFDLESSYEAAKRLMAKNGALTAIYAMSDTIAMGVIRAVLDNGLSVPDDISVIGFDGIDFASYFNPRITTFKQPQKQIATITVRLLNQMITTNANPEHILLDAEFQQGGSVKRIN